jgi:hypothetical protein
LGARTHRKKEEGDPMNKMKEKFMNFPTFDIEPKKKKKLNFFKIEKIWCFKYFFDDKEILKNSIDYDEKGTERIFVMKDIISVEYAIEAGAEKVV